MYYTTLAKIRENSPCIDGWACLLRYLAKTQPDDEPLSLATILDSNGIQDAIWVLRAVDGIDGLARIFAVRCVRQHCQHLLTDPRSLDALDVAEWHAVGEATDEELKAARTATVAAVDEGRELAWGAAWPAEKAAWGAAWLAADEARGAAEAEGEGEWAWVPIYDDFRAIFCEADAACEPDDVTCEAGACEACEA